MNQLLGEANHSGPVSRSEEIYHSLRKRIINGEYQQGQRLIVQALATDYGLSAIPIREALKILQRDGLVEIVPNRGARVVRLDSSEVPAAYLLRGMLEGLATRLAGPQLSKQDFARLEGLISQMEEAAEGADYESYYGANRSFHSAIFEACPYALIRDTLGRTWDSQTQFGLVFSIDSYALADSRREHKQLLNVLKAGEWEEAERVARNHKYAVGRRLLRALGEPIPEVLRDAQ